MQTAPHASVKTPPTITDARSDQVPTATPTASPASEPAKPTRVPRRNRLPTFAAPTSSAIQASYAPLVNVYESPQTAQSAITIQGADETPTPTTAAPMPRKPTISDRRR